MSKQIAELRKNFVSNMNKKAKDELKTNPKLKLMANDIKSHFKTNSWDLSYDIYLAESGLKSFVFNQFLLLLNMKIYFNKATGTVVFRKNKNGQKRAK
jgi:hypothetical protein